MSQYKKGITTQNNIYNSAKKMFYNYGYRGATIEKIAGDAGVPTGLVNYYFKKNEILNKVFAEFGNKVNLILKENSGLYDNNPLVRHILFSRIFFYCILKDDKTKTLYREVFEDQLLGVEQYDLGGKELTEIIRAFNIDITESIFRRLVIAEYGARRELLIDRFDRMNYDTSRDFIDFLATISIRLAGVDIKRIIACVKQADAVFTQLNLEGLSFCSYEE